MMGPGGRRDVCSLRWKSVRCILGVSGTSTVSSCPEKDLHTFIDIPVEPVIRLCEEQPGMSGLSRHPLCTTELQTTKRGEW